MIKHIVFWSFPSAEIRKEAISKLETLPPIIEEIIDFEVGVNFNPSEAAYEVALYSTFATIHDLQMYQQNPAHEEVAAFIAEHAKKRGVVDYEIDGEE